MRGVVFTGDRQAQVCDFADPVPGPGEVVVQMKASGLCGSDLHFYRQEAEKRAGSLTISGHEPSGVIAALGAGVTNVKVGDRVSVYHWLGCGRCKLCRAGKPMLCAERRAHSLSLHGSNADLMLTDESNCLPLPDELSFAVGAMLACTAGTAYSSMNKLHPSGEDTVAVFGLGPVGLCGMLVAKGMGGHVIGVEPVSERRELALDLGADEVIDPGQVQDVCAVVRDLTQGEGADLSFETSGSAAGQNGAVDCLRVGGKAVFVGFGGSGKTIDPTQIIERELTLMGSYVNPIYMYWDVIRFIVAKELPLDKMVTHRFAIEEAPEAFRLFDQGKTGKVILEWD